MTGDRVDVTLEQVRDAMRDDGWCIAIHNDYIQDGKRMTFYLFTRPIESDGSSGLFVKGEAETDFEAVRLCAKAARSLFAPSP